jgi:hypothetical protein
MDDVDIGGALLRPAVASLRARRADIQHCCHLVILNEANESLKSQRLWLNVAFHLDHGKG